MIQTISYILVAVIYAIGLINLFLYMAKFWLWFGQHCVKLAFDISDKLMESDL